MLATVASAWRLPATRQIGADQLSSVIRAMPAALVCGLVNAAIVAVGLWNDVSREALLAWLLLTLAITVGIYLRPRKRLLPEATALSPRALRRATLFAVIAALPWSILPIVYLGHVPHTDELVVITVCAGMSAGGSILLAPVYPAALTYVGMILIPFAAKCFALIGAGYGVLGVLALSYGGFLVAVIATTARLSVERTEALRALSQSTQLLRERDAIISTQNERFEMALNNMSQGLCFFDGQERLIVCNQRYIDMYGLDPERVRPGISLSDILHMRYESGACPTIRMEDYRAWRSRVASSDLPSETMYRLRDGRIFAIHYQPMADGAWVSTTDDITDRQRLADQLEQSHKALTHMATHDALTGLANRTLFRERLDAGLAASRAGESGVAVLILDLNKFKLVNDTLGHPVGDALLKAVATRLCACVRGEDMVARLGGDEFAVVVRTADPVKEAAAIAKRIQTSLTSNFDVMGCDLRIGTSIGIATCKGNVGAEELIRQADAAQYRAKGEAGDCYRFFDAALDRVVPLRRVS